MLRSPKRSGPRPNPRQGEWVSEKLTLKPLVLMIKGSNLLNPSIGPLADQEPKESRAKAVGRPKSAARRESPLAAAARRARDAVAAHSANARAKATAAGTAVAAVPKAAAKAATSSGYAARSLIERPDGGRLEKPKSQQKPPSADNASPKGLVGKMGEVLETSETSAGSTPKCVLSEDCFFKSRVYIFFGTKMKSSQLRVIATDMRPDGAHVIFCLRGSNVLYSF